MTDSAENKSPGVLSAPYTWPTIGILAMVFLAAFESMAVTAIMPAISADLHGASLYALAFAGLLAASIVGMVLGGMWADRSGPKPGLYVSVAMFVVGLIVAGVAPTMPVFIVGRLVQGFASGVFDVALYVVVARAYPSRLQPALFGAFAAAWVVPSLIGPFIAGLVAQYLSWHWVFLGVVALILAAAGMVLPTIRRIDAPSAAERAPWNLARIGWSIVAAVAVLALNLTAEAPGWLKFAGPVASAAVALIALRPLLPPRTFTFAPGLPSVIAVRGILAGAFFGAETYVPYLLTTRYDLTPAFAGLALTCSAVAWGITSGLQGRMRHTPHRRIVAVGVALTAVSLGLLFAVTALSLPAWLVGLSWAIGGAGMGLSFPRLSVVTLEESTVGNQGFNSAALNISNSGGAAIVIAVMGGVFVGFASQGSLASFVAALAVPVVLMLVAVATAHRAVGGTAPVAPSRWRLSRNSRATRRPGGQSHGVSGETSD